MLHLFNPLKFQDFIPEMNTSGNIANLLTHPSVCVYIYIYMPREGVLYPGHSLGGLTPLQRCSQCILQPQPTEQSTRRLISHKLDSLFLQLDTSCQCKKKRKGRICIYNIINLAFPIIDPWENVHASIVA